MKLPFFIEKKLLEKLGAIHTIVELTTTNLNGKIVNHKKFIGKSLTANFLQGLYALMGNNTTSADFPASGLPFSANHNIIDVTNASYTITNSANYVENFFRLNNPVGSDGWGTVVGTGNTAVTPQDYKLQTKIANGIGAGQLSYMQQGCVSGVNILGAVSSLILNRIYVNGSGGDITVNEVGIYTWMITNTKATCIYRDIVVGGQLVPSTNTLTCQITFQITT